MYLCLDYTEFVYLFYISSVSKRGVTANCTSSMMFQAGKKVALQASAALQQAWANCGQPLPPPTAQLPFFLAVPSEKDCIAGGGAVDNGDGTSSELYDRMKPLRVSVLAFDLTRGLCLVIIFSLDCEARLLIEPLNLGK